MLATVARALVAFAPVAAVAALIMVAYATRLAAKNEADAASAASREGVSGRHAPPCPPSSDPRASVNAATNAGEGAPCTDRQLQ